MYWTKTPQVTNITCGQNIKDKMLDYTGNLNSSWISRCSSWDFEKAEEAKIKLSTSTGSLKKQEISKEISTSALLIMPKPLTVWTTTNSGKFLEIGIPDHLTCLLRNLYAGQEATVRTGHGIQTGSKSGKEYVKAVHCHCAYLTYMQSTS